MYIFRQIEKQTEVSLFTSGDAKICTKKMVGILIGSLS
jgi:hypothetical protein